MIHTLALQLPTLGEWCFIAVIGLLVLVFNERGAQWLGRSIGQAVRAFKKGLNEG